MIFILSSEIIHLGLAINVAESELYDIYGLQIYNVVQNKCSSSLTMILVLLYRFSESEDSILGYRLCKKLVQEGHHLLVTITAKHEEIRGEEESARTMSQKYMGKITLLKPECEEDEEPSPKWIAKLHKTYFWLPVSTSGSKSPYYYWNVTRNFQDCSGFEK